jgi:hypothetical protein
MGIGKHANDQIISLTGGRDVSDRTAMALDRPRIKVPQLK